MESNKLIAEFMRWNIKSPNTIPTNLHLSNLELDNGEVMELQFHKDWNWLMPVVEKIETLGYWFNRTDGDVTIVDDNGDIVVNTPNSDGGIDIYHKAVVEFIKQYNDEQNKA